jgi:hypothetical protein
MTHAHGLFTTLKDLFPYDLSSTSIVKQMESLGMQRIL